MWMAYRGAGTTPSFLLLYKNYSREMTQVKFGGVNIMKRTVSCCLHSSVNMDKDIVVSIKCISLDTN